MVRCSDQREIALIRNSEDDAVVGILENVAAVMLEDFRHNDMAALHKTDIIRIVFAKRFADDVVHPWAGRIDQHFGLHFFRFACD